VVRGLVFHYADSKTLGQGGYFVRKYLSSLQTRLLLIGALLVMAFLAMSMTAQAASFSGSGSGTPADPYIITTPEQLNEIWNNLGAHYKLGAHIDLSGYMNWTPIGNDAIPFTGSLDGDSYTITGLYIDRAMTTYAGLFGYIDGADLKDLALENAFVSGYDNVGGLVGYMLDGSVSNCSFNGSVRGDSGAGGLIGSNYNGTVSNCRTAGGVSGRVTVGGLAGANYGSIENCHARMTVEGSGFEIGGLVGYNGTASASVSGCSATGSVRGKTAGGLIGMNYGIVSNSFSRGAVTLVDYDSSDGGNAGGLIGYNYGVSVSGCYSLSSVASEDSDGADINLGGLIGYNSNGNVSDCYATGSVSAALSSRVGGLIGDNDAAVTRCYAVGAVSGGTEGGLVGRNSGGGSISDSYWNSYHIDEGVGQISGGIVNVTDKISADMKKQSTFADWDFAGTWAIGEGATYPYLQWQQTAYTDTAPPYFAVNYPAYEQATSQGFTLKVKTDEDAVAYYVILDNNDELGYYHIYYPYSAIRSGMDDEVFPTDWSILPPNRYGSVSVTAGTEAAVTITGLAFATPYDVYFLAEDGAGNYAPLIIKLDAATALSSENDITGFTVTGQAGDSTIDTASHTVEFHMPNGTEVTSLTPTITVSAGAAISPASGTAQDFSAPVSYTVTAEDGTEQVWTVTCIVDPAIDLSGFDVQLAVPGDKTAGIAFDLSITNANGTDGAALSGDVNVTVTSDQDNTVHNAAVTFTDGTVTVPVTLATEGEHTLTVNVAGVTNPETVNVTVTEAVITGSISGTVYYDDDGGGGGLIEGATVTVTVDGTDYTATTAADGTYTITGVPAGMGYTVTASKAGYDSDMVTDVTVTAGSTTADVNFHLATSVLNGVIAGVAKDSGNNPISGVTVSLSVNGTVYQAITDENGTYTITNVPAGSGYSVTAGKTGYISETADNVTITAGSTTTVNFTLSAAGGGGDSGSDGDDKDDRNSRGDSTNHPAAPTYKSTISGTNTTGISLPVTVNTNTGSATTDLGTLANDIFTGTGTTVITVPDLSGVNFYTLGIPADSLSSSQGEGSLTFSTGAGSITIPSGMLTGIPGTEGKTAGITIGQGDKSGLPEDVKAAIGDRPIVQITLTLDGKQTEWNNPEAPVTVSIPYIPTAEELANPESIVVWYIDGSGNVVSVPNGRYDPATGTVTFTTTHFSYYAVGYKQVSFKDVAKDAWYAKAVSFIAARDITTGTGGGNFSPEAKLSRGQFIVMLMKAYGITPDTNPEDNFADAGSTYYTGYLAAARRLGISAGVGNNMFAPEREITRQEMFTLLYNGLKVIGKLPRGNSGKTLSDFSDSGDIAPWAKDAMKLLVETGTVGGSGGKLTPTDTTTRAQMAQVLYSLLSK